MRPTIKDIARATGVSHGTVSNVLNKKGNVSVEKIKLVEEAARRMGYKINKKAKLLREGTTKSIALILPSLEFPEYMDLHTEIKTYAHSLDYTLHLFLTNDIPAQEMDILKEILSLRIDGILSVTCLEHAEKYYKQSGLDGTRTIFLERRASDGLPFAGFDYHQVGVEIGEYIIKNNFQTIGLLTGDIAYSNHQEFVRGIQSVAQSITIHHVHSHINQASTAAFNLFNEESAPELIITTSRPLHDAVLSAHTLGSLAPLPELICLSTLRANQNRSSNEYHLNYMLLGRKVCERLIHLLENGESKEEPEDLILPSDGFIKTFHPTLPIQSDRTLNVLFLDCPSTDALKKLSPYFTKQTGIKVKFHVFPLSEMYDVISTVANSGVDIYDVIRMDMAWLPWFAPQSLLPLNEVNPNIDQVFTRFLPQLKEKYCQLGDIIYALPFDPSVQMMFYRKDLFEDAIYRRAYYELTKSQLQVPTTFEEYNQVARFFTRAYNPESPTEYGATVALGYPSSTASELLPRLICQEDMYDEQGRIRLDSPVAAETLRGYIETTQYANMQESQWWKSVVNNFSSGKAAMTIVYTNHAADIIHTQDSAVAGKIGYATIPGGKPLIGGGVMGISKYSSHVNEAYTFLEWASSEAISAEMTMMAGMSPCANAYQNMQIVHRYPWLQSITENIIIGERMRALSTSGEIINQRSFEHMLGIMIRNAIIGTMSPEEAMKHAANFLDKCMQDPFAE